MRFSMLTRALPMSTAVLIAAVLASCSSSHTASRDSISATATPTPVAPTGSAIGTQTPSPVPTSAVISATTPTPTPSTSTTTTPATGTAPANPAVAESQIRTVFTGAFGKPPGSGRYYGLGFVENGDQLRGAVDRVIKNFPQNGGDITVTLGAITFSSPDSAAVQFTPHYTGGAPYGTQTGEAVFSGGRWVVTQQTYCGLLRYGGVTCP
jgi:hypothetical protein